MNDYLFDKYFNDMDQEHLMLKYQLTLDEENELENKHFNDFVEWLGKEKGKDYADRAITKKGDYKPTICSISGSADVVVSGGSEAGFPSESDRKFRIALMFNMIFAIYDKWLFPGKINQAPARYIKLLSDMHGKFDAKTERNMNTIINGYINAVKTGNIIDENDALASYDNFVGLVGEEYHLRPINGNIWVEYEDNGKKLTLKNGACEKEIRHNLWKEIVELRGKDFDPHGYTTDEMISIRDSLSL